MEPKVGRYMADSRCLGNGQGRKIELRIFNCLRFAGVGYHRTHRDLD